MVSLIEAIKKHRETKEEFTREQVARISVIQRKLEVYDFWGDNGYVSKEKIDEAVNELVKLGEERELVEAALSNNKIEIIEEKQDKKEIREIRQVINKSSKEIENLELHKEMTNALLLRDKMPELLDKSIELFVKVLKQRIKIYTWADDNSKEMWVYDDGYYTSNGKCVLEKEIREILGEIYSHWLVTKIIERIEVDTYISPVVFNEKALNHSHEINARNGIVKIDSTTYEVTLTPHSPENIFLYKLDVDYNPDSRCPVIDKFFEDTLAVITDRDALHESIGTALDPTLITKKATISYGEPDTGKSTSTNLIHTFLGKNNCGNLTLQQVTEDKFLLSGLYGRIANIAGDLSSEAVKNIDVFKRLTGNDPFEGDRKYKIAIKFNNQAKFFFNMNKLPRIYNADQATWNRMMTFKYVRIFVDKQVYDTLPEDKKKLCGIKDDNILKRMTSPQELSGLLNHAIAGLIRFYKNGRFSYAKGVEEVSKEWIRLSDSFMAFCIDNLEHGVTESDYILRKKLASEYSKYCKKHGVRAVGDKSMKSTLSSEYGVYVEGYTCVPGGNDRCWEGIRFKVGMDGTLL